jgi:hypothetical protein
LLVSLDFFSQNLYFHLFEWLSSLPLVVSFCVS